MMSVSEIIADLRRAGLTQNEIADAVGISQGTVSDLCTGRRGKRPSAQTTDALRALWAKRVGRSRTSRQ